MFHLPTIPSVDESLRCLIIFCLRSSQIDETTDMADLARLCVYAGYVHKKCLEDESLFCKSLNTRTTANDIFQKVDQLFNMHGINWEHAVGVCTDSAPAMHGCHSGSQTMVKEKPPDAIRTDCTHHHQALMVKTMPDQLKNVLNHVVKVVNFIKTNSLNLRLFVDLCKDNDSGFEMLLLYLHVRWLSKRRVLKRVFVL
ncbi:SCAN domain-containing protein 3-like [Octopus bimaculoides]|uniref:SCAN domain-containing protein 3-like n=1 Tax=Octopus bimaculoides TaxID=37653 RepID=UPI00071D0D39|nr:SCAN domain-containing protein 3-like [Octopus bimaculoides]|eukprot:XP_014778813.1 PREDICTED: SCAN domain-containing protein 3-like [Octopus bimaculoides]